MFILGETGRNLYPAGPHLLRANQNNQILVHHGIALFYVYVVALVLLACATYRFVEAPAQSYFLIKALSAK